MIELPPMNKQAGFNDECDTQGLQREIFHSRLAVSARRKGRY